MRLFTHGGTAMAESAEAAYYRMYSARCFEIARQVLDPKSKATLLYMAQSWLALAEQAYKNRQTTLVYETQAPQQVAQQQQQPQPAKK
jgi:hypothetical protein